MTFDRTIPASVHTLPCEFCELIFEATIGFNFTDQNILQQSIRILSILRFSSSTDILFLVSAAVTFVVKLVLSFPIIASPITANRNFQV